jgi:hypothetical protein
MRDKKRRSMSNSSMNERDIAAPNFPDGDRAASRPKDRNTILRGTLLLSLWRFSRGCQRKNEGTFTFIPFRNRDTKISGAMFAFASAKLTLTG